MFEGTDSHELDFIVSRLPQLRYSELGPEPGRIFVVRDSLGHFLRCFYQGRPQSTSFLRHALLFDNLRLCATFGRFWAGIAAPAILPLRVDHQQLPHIHDIHIVKFGRSHVRPEPVKPVWKLI
jgi:hypothetical protein